MKHSSKLLVLLISLLFSASSLTAAEVQVSDADSWKSLQSDDTGVFSAAQTINNNWGQLTFTDSVTNLTLRSNSETPIVITTPIKIVQNIQPTQNDPATMNLTVENLEFKGDGTTLTGALFGATIGNSATSYRYYEWKNNSTINATLNNAKFTDLKSEVTNDTSSGSVFFAKTVNITGEDVTISGSYSTTGSGMAPQDLNINLKNATFSGNSSKNAAGAMRASSSITLTGSDITFDGNSCGSLGGALFVEGNTINISGSNIVFKNNKSGTGGGAIASNNAENTIKFFGNDSSVTFSNNKQNTKTTETLNDVNTSGSVVIQDTGKYVFGGGIVASKDLTISDADVTFGAGSSSSFGGTTTLTNSILRFVLSSAGTTFNVINPPTETTTGTGATAVTTNTNNTVLYTIEDATAAASYTVTGLDFSGLTNTTKAAFVKQTDGNAGKVAYVSNDAMSQITVKEVADSTKPVHVLKDGTITSNTWDSSISSFATGCTIFLTDDISYSAYNNKSGTITLQSNSDTVRTITAASTGDNPNRLFQDGGTLNLTLHNVSIEGYEGQWAGGAIRENNTTISGSNYTFRNNSGCSGGCAIYGRDSVSISGTDVLFEGNSNKDSKNAPGSGGAVWSQQGAVTISGTRVTFKGNQAKLTGGAVAAYNNNDLYSQAVTVTLSGNDLQFLNNSTQEGSGGAVFAGNSVTIKDFSTITFSRNASGKHGGAIYGNTLNITGDTTSSLTFTSNAATENGGAIYTCSTTTIKDFSSILFSQNTAQNGGAIYSGKTLTITGNSSSSMIFTGNTATALGNDIYVDSGELSITNGSYYFNGGIYVNSGKIFVNQATITLAEGAQAITTAENGIWNSKLVLDFSESGLPTEPILIGDSVKLGVNSSVELILKEEPELFDTISLFQGNSFTVPSSVTFTFKDLLGNIMTPEYVLVQNGNQFGLVFANANQIPEPAAWLLLLLGVALLGFTSGRQNFPGRQ